jgi:hypothetical protein
LVEKHLADLHLTNSVLESVDQFTVGQVTGTIYLSWPDTVKARWKLAKWFSTKRHGTTFGEEGERYKTYLAAIYNLGQRKLERLSIKASFALI